LVAQRGGDPTEEMIGCATTERIDYGGNNN